jgi:hypothetical protein
VLLHIPLLFGRGWRLVQPAFSSAAFCMKKEDEEEEEEEEEELCGWCFYLLLSDYIYTTCLQRE